MQQVAYKHEIRCRVVNHHYGEIAQAAKGINHV
jgi:hypothetical protein